MQKRHNGVKSMGEVKRPPRHNKHSWDLVVSAWAAPSPPTAPPLCPHAPSCCGGVFWDALGYGHHSKFRKAASPRLSHQQAASQGPPGLVLRMEMKSQAKEVSVCDPGAGGLGEDLRGGMYHWRSCDLCGLWAPNYPAQCRHQPVRSLQSGVLV